MTGTCNFATSVVAAAMMCFPLVASAQSLIATTQTSVSARSAMEQRVSVAVPRVIAFDWLANGDATPSPGKAKLALERYRVITGRGSWICTPAGFGQRSKCYAG